MYVDARVVLTGGRATRGGTNDYPYWCTQLGPPITDELTVINGATAASASCSRQSALRPKPINENARNNQLIVSLVMLRACDSSSLI